MRSLTQEEHAQLCAFALIKGRSWRTIMNRFWYRGEPVPGYPLLYGLRNSHGPEWLDAWELPSDYAPTIGTAMEAAASVLRRYGGNHLPAAEAKRVFIALQRVTLPVPEKGETA
jgi:hypothetical protein